MQYSENLKLNLPERNDQYNLDHWNENTNIIDSELKEAENHRQFLLEKINQEISDRQSGDTEAKNLANATGVLAVAKGGTGATTVQEAHKKIVIGGVKLYTETFADSSNLISTDSESLLTRPCVEFWEYIKDKISSVLGLTASNYKGTSAKATQDVFGNNIVNTYATNTALNNQITAVKNELTPVGTIQAGMWKTAPAGWLLCNGQRVLRDSYPNLYQCAVNNEWGTPDGSGFYLPNLTGRFLQGGTVGQYKEAGLPNITGNTSLGSTNYYGEEQTGAFYRLQDDATFRAWHDNSSARLGFLQFDASKSNSIYGNSSTVQPPSYCITYIIKY